MDEARSDIALLRAVLLENCGSDAAAGSYLADARALGVDPLDYCAHRFGLGEADVWERAAHWARFGFFPTVPQGADVEGLAPPRLDQLSGLRSVRRLILDREVRFIAPRFEQFVRLARSRALRPDLAAGTCVVPPSQIELRLGLIHRAALATAALTTIKLRWPLAHAGSDRTLLSRVLFVAAFAVLVILTATASLFGPWLLPLLAVLLMVPGIARLVAAFGGAPNSHEPPPLRDSELPVYSVLIPLRDEANMIPALARAMRALDYPPEKLDIRFVVEETSTETVEAVRILLADPRFRLVLVPDCKPRTKPKALDYALLQAQGEFLVIYDAEDEPEADQLRRAAARFAADAELVCLQAELVPANAEENGLTALFAGEYAGLFGRFLPALARWGVPLPLGGTSNHFRLSALREIGGWDPHNVTEDADLGVRLARRGMRVETIASRTYEEAPLSLGAWMKQRSRWLKGWMVTLIVHNRRPLALLRDLGWRGFIGFELLVSSMILSSALHTVFLAAAVLRLAWLGPAGLLPQDVWGWCGIVILLTGYGGAMAIVISGLFHLRRWRMLAIQFLLPAYWVLHFVAALRAAVDLLRQPDHWDKTTHGVTRLQRDHAAAIVAKAASRAPAE